MRKHNLLFVGSDPNNWTYLINLLNSNYNISLAKDCSGALRSISITQPQLIVCSLVLSGMCCFSFNTLLKKSSYTGQIPVMLFCDAYDSNTIVYALKKGMEFTITKNTPSAQVIAQIENRIQQRKRLKNIYNQSVDKDLKQYSISYQMDEILITQINELIESNLENPNLNIDFLSTHLGMSRSILQTRVKKITGQSLGKHIRRLKLEKAKEMLAHTDLLIYEIADKVGFSSKQSFIKSFKLFYNTLPSSFRKESWNYSSHSPV